LEVALARSWTAKIEYIYDSLGKETYLGTPVRLEGQTVRVGVNFLFH
jgi:opacity protein-like surface antigen